MLLLRRWLMPPVLLLLLVLTGNFSMTDVHGHESAPKIRITDATGHTVIFDTLPERIVIAGKANILIQNAAFLFGSANNKVIAIENQRQNAFNFLLLVDPSISEKTFLKANAGPEQIAAVNPDLVLIKNFLAESLGSPLKKLNIPVLCFNFETPTAFYKDIQTLGAVFGNPERATEINQFYQSRVNRVTREVSDLKAHPKVLIIEHSENGGSAAFKVPPAHWLQTRMVKICGGIPVWDKTVVSKGWRIITVEQIAVWDPDQIFLVDYKGKAESAVVVLQKDPIWAQLQAVQNNQLHAFSFDFYSWDQPDPRWILGLQWLATRIHPEIQTEINIRAEVEAFYRTLYRLSPEIIESEVYPMLKGVLP